MFTYDTMIYSMVINILATTTLLKELFTTFNSCIVFSKFLFEIPLKKPRFQGANFSAHFSYLGPKKKFVGLMNNKPGLKSL